MKNRGLMMKSCYKRIMFVVQVLWIVHSIDGLDYFETVGGFTFDHVQPDWLSIPPTGYGVLYMEQDQFIPGNILLIDSHAIKTLDPQTNETTVIAGSEDYKGYREGIGAAARFQAPLSFHQINSTHVIITDTVNHCFRMLSRVSNSTSMLAGLCTISGNDTGTFPLARFNEPYKIVELQPGILAFTDSVNENIKKLDFINNEVTVLTQFNQPVFALAIRPGTSDLYFSFHGGFGFVDISTFQTVEYVTQVSRTGYRDGALKDYAVFTVRPETLLFLSKDVMLVAGFRTHLIRIVNFVNEFVSSICDPEPEGNTTRSGDIETCQLSYPRSLLTLREEGRVLIGFSSSLGYMQVTGLSRTTTSTTTKPAPTTATTKPSTTRKPTTTTTTTAPSGNHMSTARSGQGTTLAVVQASEFGELPLALVQIVGIVVGGLAFIVLVIVGGVCIKRNYIPRQQSDNNGRSPSGPEDDLIVYDEIDTRKVCSTYEITVGKSPTPPPPRASNNYETPQKTITTTLPRVPSVPLFHAPQPPMEMSDLSKTAGESFADIYYTGPVAEELRDSSYMEMSGK